uniref:Uncharacterized protein n=1 Tax=Arundo donax TaxID=35708 RepID=A0A0A9HW08_ARUDO
MSSSRGRLQRTPLPFLFLDAGFISEAAPPPTPQARSAALQPCKTTSCCSLMLVSINASHFQVHCRQAG